MINPNANFARNLKGLLPTIGYTLARVARHLRGMRGFQDTADTYGPAKKGRITDFLSFFTICHTVNNHPNHSFIKVAYSFYNVSTATLLVDLMADKLVLAKRENVGPSEVRAPAEQLR